MYTDNSKLFVWQKSHQLVLEIYNLTKDFPKEEQYGLTSQIRRASVSICSNIVEGKARGSTKDFIRFLMMSRGSLEEVKYQALLAKDLNYITEAQYDTTLDLSNEVGKLLNGLINKLIRD